MRRLMSGSAVRCAGLVALLSLLCMAMECGIGVAKTPPSGKVSTAPITADQLLAGTRAPGLTRNDRFAPVPGRAASAPSFVGTLRLSGARMGIVSSSHGRIANPVGGKDTRFFPNVGISFFTVGSHLVPTTQNVIRNGVLPHTRSYWDVIVQPGEVWTQPGDDGWHRASFPFALMNSVEGETHTGIAMFLYRGRRVSPVRFQIVQQTAPFDVPQYFSAWGTSRASFVPGVRGVSTLRRGFAREQRAQWPERSWQALTGKAPESTLRAFTRYPDVLQSAAVRGRTIYRTDCPTAAGPFPYCNAVRYGVWSVTKSAMLNVATLRLAELYGTGFLNRSIAPYIAGADESPGWSDVTFEDLANMASGHGPKGHGTCYLCDYTRWYLAPSEADKTAQALNYPLFTTPGTRFNYRDQDAYLLGVADANFLKAHAGQHATISKMLLDQVYRPIGIYTAPTNATIQRGGSSGQPLMAYGFYPTLDDLAKIARLYENGGSSNGHQILDRQLVEHLLTRKTVQADALPAGGAEHYLLDWHIVKMHASASCTRYVPQAEGWGGNTVTLLPGHTTLIRMRNNWVATPHPQATVDALSAKIAPLCR